MTILLGGTLILVACAALCVAREYRQRRAARRAGEDGAVDDMLAGLDEDDGGHW